MAPSVGVDRRARPGRLICVSPEEGHDGCDAGRHEEERPIPGDSDHRWPHHEQRRCGEEMRVFVDTDAALARAWAEDVYETFRSDPSPL